MNHMKPEYIEEHVNDLTAQMVQVDRNLAKQRETKRKHGRALNVSANARARVAGRRGGRKMLREHDKRVAQGRPGLWLPR
jgi:hypothetical protein